MLLRVTLQKTNSGNTAITIDILLVVQTHDAANVRVGWEHAQKMCSGNITENTSRVSRVSKCRIPSTSSLGLAPLHNRCNLYSRVREGCILSLPLAKEVRSSWPRHISNQIHEDAYGNKHNACTHKKWLRGALTTFTRTVSRRISTTLSLSRVTCLVPKPDRFTSTCRSWLLVVSPGTLVCAQCTLTQYGFMRQTLSLLWLQLFRFARPMDCVSQLCVCVCFQSASERASSVVSLLYHSEIPHREVFR